MTTEQIKRQSTESIATLKYERFADLQGLDLSGEDLTSLSTETLLTCDFDTRTIWPTADKLPAGFNPRQVIEEGKNPGLGIRELHKQGIDGRGITVAIIDQVLSSKRGEFRQNTEFGLSILEYKEINMPEDETISMHGPAVASLLVGKNCGVAPRARLVYRAVPCMRSTETERNFNHEADALLDIIAYNKTLPVKDRVRIVSCSIGYQERRPEPGLDRWIDAIKTAEAAGIVVSDVGDRTGVDYLGGGTSGNKDDIESYDYALFLKDGGEDDKQLKELILKKDVEGILKRFREIKQDQLFDISDHDLRKKIEDYLTFKWEEMIVPSDYRTISSRAGAEDYTYNAKGGMSWAVPYLSGIFALVWQIKPELTKEEISEIINKTATANSSGTRVINPRGIIEGVKSLR